jgi:hypothetical protein
LEMFKEMSAGKIRGKILTILWVAGTPIPLQQISEKIGLDPSQTRGYLLSLIKAKYVSVPQKNFCAITDRGKQAIGLPQVDKNLAIKILSSLPLEKAFYFYSDMDQYSGVHADSFKDFVNKIQTIDLKSIEFHIPRKDFEFWISSLGDAEFSKKLGMLRTKKLHGEDLRKELYEIANSRYEELKNLTV